MIPGIEVAMGGRDWLIPPLTLGQLRRLMPKVRQLTEIGASMGEPQIGVLVEIVTTALQRNYPDLTTDTVENLLDLGNAGAVLNAVLTGSGLKPRGNLVGEAVAVVIPPSSPEMVGDTSMASSPPPADTAIP
jgi:hypothetical protein